MKLMCFVFEKLKIKKLINSMNFKIINNSSSNMDLNDLVQSLGGFAQKRFGFKKPPSIHFDSDNHNASLPLGKTGFYDPNNLEIHIFVDGRHPKDILRSIAHELVHHTQNEQGSLVNNGYAGEGYAQKNPHLRNMEKDAYERGNMCFRDWEDNYKQKNPTIYTERRNKMSLKEWKNKELGQQLMNRWGFNMNLDGLTEESSNVLKENKEITHMCALHVEHKNSGLGGHPIAHTLNENGDVSHYTVEFDSVIVENIPVENLNVLQQEEHSHKRDDMKPHDEEKEVVSEEELEEVAKPDYLDLDKDGDKEESMKDAAEDAKDLEEVIFNKIMEILGSEK